MVVILVCRPIAISTLLVNLSLSGGLVLQIAGDPEACLVCTQKYCIACPVSPARAQKLDSDTTLISVFGSIANDPRGN